MSTSHPIVVVIAGPNGAGKTTSASRLLQDALAVHEFVNADTIAAGLSAFRPESVSFAAGRLMLRRMKALATANTDFAFETTLASRSFAPWLKELQEKGYRVHLMMLTLPTPDLAVARVATRVRLGGHHVSEEVVRRRFHAGLKNFFRLYRPLAFSWQLLDNAHSDQAHLIAEGSYEHSLEIRETERWEILTTRYEE